MMLKKIPLPSQEQTLELSAIIEHSPWAKNFLHLGCSDGKICQIASSFFQFDHVIGIDDRPEKIALCLMRKNYYKIQMKMSHFYFHHLEFPLRELSGPSIVFMSCLALPGWVQLQLSYWLNESANISTVASTLALPFNSKEWFVRSIEEFNEKAIYIYQRIT